MIFLHRTKDSRDSLGSPQPFCTHSTAARKQDSQATTESHCQRGPRGYQEASAPPSGGLFASTGHTCEGIIGIPLHQLPARAAFPKSTYTPSHALALLPNARSATLAPRRAGMSPLWAGRRGAGRSCDPAPSLQLSPAVHPSRPGVWAEPSLPRLRETGSARGNSPRSHCGRFPDLPPQKGSGVQHLLLHLEVRSRNNPSGESRRYLVRRRPPVPPGRAGLQGSGRSAVAGRSRGPAPRPAG